MRLDNKYVNKTIKEYSQSDAIGFKIEVSRNKYLFPYQSVALIVNL